MNQSHAENITIKEYLDQQLPIISSGTDGNSNGNSNAVSNLASNGGSNGGSKQRYTVLCSRIVDICHNWKCVQEIASIINYSPKYIGSRIIPRMVSEGLLELYDKQSSTNPNQKYRATKGKT